MTNVSLKNNKIGANGAIALAEALTTSKVTHIDLSSNNIGVYGAISIAEALPTSKVTHIDLSRNSIGVNGAISIAEALPTSKVIHISLSDNIGVNGLNALKSVCRNHNSTSMVETYCDLPRCDVDNPTSCW